MLEGAKVRLRPPEMADLERNFGWINDAEVNRFLQMRYGMSLAAEEAWMRERTARPLAYDNVFFAVETLDGRHIGNINFFNTSPEDRKTELGVMIGDKSCWSQGYGTDAIATLLRFGFEEMNLNRIELNVYAENDRAIACYRKCGFVEEGRLRQARYQEGRYQDVVLMSVLREEWLARQRP